MSSDYPILRNAKFNDRVDRSPAHVPILNLICPAHSFTFRQHSDAEPKPVVPSIVVTQQAARDAVLK
jgi:hypothetical protein